MSSPSADLSASGGTPCCAAKRNYGVRMNELALFAGAGGGILGGKLLGWRTVCAVERDAYAAQVLVQRQNDGTFEPFPVWSDVCSFDGRPWRGVVDVVSGGFPCTDISAAGRGAGIDGEKSGLWREMARIICEVRPRFVFVENSPVLTSRGLGRVLGDLAEMGFDAEWGVLSAAEFGAPHLRERIWIVADSRRELRPERVVLADSGESEKRGAEAQKRSDHRQQLGVGAETFGGIQPWEATKPGLARMADGVAHCAHRIVAIGNGQVPRVAAAAWRILTHNCEVRGDAPLAQRPSGGRRPERT